MRFVNREEELKLLEVWWARTDAGMGLVWGRKRVGKTALLERFSRERPVVFHTGTKRPEMDELRTLSRIASSVFTSGLRNFVDRPFTDWFDALETIASFSTERPHLLVIDEFPDLCETSPALPAILRAFWDRARGHTRLKILLSGSAVRTMEALQEERSPLFGRTDLRLQLHPFRPHEAVQMLPRLKPVDRALAWGLAGGIPLYLEWWDQDAGIRDNLLRLVCTPGGLLLTEGEYILATECSRSGLARQVLNAIATGRTRYNQIEQIVRTNPSRVLDDLIGIRLVDRLSPVTENPDRTRRKIYRLADNFLTFWLKEVSRYRAEIDRGLGRSILPVLLSGLDDHMGSCWEAAYLDHLRRLVIEGRFGSGIVAVGPFWSKAADPAEIDAVILSGRRKRAVLVGDAKWARKVDGRRIRRDLERKAIRLPLMADDMIYSVCARESVSHAEDLLVVTADDIFN